MTSGGITRAGGRLAFAAVGILCLVTFALLVSQTVRNLRLLEDAQTDNVQWGLSQVEVEYLELLAETYKPHPDLSALRTEFDIFFSRMAIVAEASMYGDLRSQPDFAENLAIVRSDLEALIPLVDAPDSQLLDDVGQIRATLVPLRPLIRTLATLGVARSVAVSETRRVDVRLTLAQLAFLTFLLILALAGLIVVTMRAERRARRQGTALADVNNRLNKVLETSLEAVIVSDINGRILEFNPAAEQIFQRSKDSVLGKTVGDTVVPQAYRKAHEEGMARFRQSNAQRFLGKGRVRLDAVKADGTIFPVEMALEQASTENDTLVIGFMRDISRRVRAEVDLVEARDKALAGEKAKADFLAMMTHEIRTPLNGLLGNVSLLGDTELSDTQARYLHNMQISGAQLQGHVDAVLDIARFDAEPVRSQRDPVRIGALVQDIVDAQSGAAQLRGNTLGWRWSGEPAEWLTLDASRVQQVMVNLVGNAIKYTRNGSVQIELEQGHARGGRYLEFRVMDNGIGIPDAMLDAIFEDFRTVGSPDGDDVGGTGLGLGIARRFVEAMSGNISVESTPGEGSVFRVQLPAEPTDPPNKEVGPAASAPQLPCCRVLLAEDNDISLQVAREMLKRLGAIVHCVQNGAQAVESAQAEPFDLILMDMRMPQMDGLTATRSIRQSDGPNHATPIVVVSANVLPDGKDAYRAAGVSDFLGKPLRRDNLEQIIRTHCPAAAQGAGANSASEALPLPATSITDALQARFNAELTALFDDFSAGVKPLPEMAEFCHQCAGSAGVFGHETLAATLLEAETMARAGLRPETNNALTRARDIWQDVH